MVSWAREPFCVPPHFLFLGNKHQPPGPSLSSKGQVQTVALRGRAGMERSCQETIVQLWGQGPGPSSRSRSNTISVFFCRSKTPNTWKMLMKHFFYSGKKTTRPLSTSFENNISFLCPGPYLWPFFSLLKL